jgi:hypothetical protein
MPWVRDDLAEQQKHRGQESVTKLLLWHRLRESARAIVPKTK